MRSSGIDVESKTDAASVTQPIEFTSKSSTRLTKVSRSKKARRAKAKAHKSGAFSATESQGEESDLNACKAYHSAMTSPCVSGSTSLSSSPAVHQLVYSKPVGQTDGPNDECSTALDQSVSSERPADGMNRDETLISLQESVEQTTTLVDESKEITEELAGEQQCAQQKQFDEGTHEMHDSSCGEESSSTKQSSGEIINAKNSSD